MKIRTDFVTNSSSTSFIFKEYDSAKIKEAIEKRLSEPFRDGDDEFYYEMAKNKSIKCKRFKDYCLYTLFEVFGWYRDEVIGELIGIDYDINLKPNQENGARLTALFIMDMYRKIYKYNHWTDEKNDVQVEYDYIFSNLGEFFSSRYVYEDEMVDFYANNMEQLMMNTKDFEGKHLGDVLEIFFDAKYLYYDDLETIYLIEEALTEAGLCSYTCSHMG